MTDQNTDQPVVPSEKTVKDQIALLSFVDEIIKERKDPTTTQENLQKVREILLKQVNDAINRQLIGLLTDKDQIELDDLLEKNVKDEEIDSFFAKKIPNLESEIASILLNFRAAFLYPVRDRLQQEAQQKSNSQNMQPPPPPDPAPVENGSSFLPPAPVPTDKVN